MNMKIEKENSELKMRAWDFEKDHENVIKLLDIVFEKELESKGLNVKVIFDEFKSILPLMKLLGIFSKNFKHTLDGFVFENEEGEIVASVNISYSLFYWEVAMVATSPDYRRRGLARQLVTAAINHAKELGAKLIVLEVLDINEPAYKLYRNLGFAHYDSLTRLKLAFSKLNDITSIDLPEEYELREFARNKKANQARYELDMRVTPEDVQVFHPVDRKKYFKPLMIRMVRPIAKFLLKLKRFDWLIYQGETLVGDVSVYPSRKEGSPHKINLMLDPAHSENLSEPMIAHSLVTLRKNTAVVENIIVEFRTTETKQLETARTNGFVDVETMHLLGLKTEE
ncbi:MAG: GNAT family N-acetyltransferase [Candidatus Heimdallarchaeaceae archaeon]